MHHLRYLRIFNQFWGVVMLLGAIGLLLTGCFVLRTSGMADSGQIIASSVGAFGSAVLLFILSSLHFKAGRRVEAGSGRTLQTILAVLQIASFPLGTAYGIYALWICWSNIDTKYMFERG